MIDEKKLIEKLDRLEKIASNYRPDVAHVCTNLLCEITDFINEQPKVGEWIPCSERLPKIGERALITTTNHGVRFATRLKYGWDGYIFPYAMEEVTAWQPLPEPYEVKDND